MRLDAKLEIVNLRVRGTGLVAPPRINAHPSESSDPKPALIEYRKVVIDKSQMEETPFYHGESLKTGNIINGPAVILRDDTTVLIGKTDSASVDPFLNLVVKIDN